MSRDLSFASKSAKEALTAGDVWEAERFLFEQPDSLIKNVALRLHIEVMRLSHELNDPQYQYSGRIHRHALLCRNADIDTLRKEVKEKDETIKQLKAQILKNNTKSNKD